MRRIEYETNEYKVYEILDINRHNIKKFWKTNRNKELNSFLRDKLASLIRKTYSKGIKSLTKYLSLIFVSWGLI